jgi:hypothetical protein
MTAKGEIEAPRGNGKESLGHEYEHRKVRTSTNIRHDAARRRTIARRGHDSRTKTGSRRVARRDGRRHHRSGISDFVERRFRIGRGNRQAREEFRRLRLGAGRLQGHRSRGRRDPPGQTRPHPHLHLDESRPYEAQTSDGPNAVLDAVGASVVRARNFTDDVQWSAEDATRTEEDFLCRCVELAIRSGATTINIPDTVGYTTPQEYVDLIRMLRERVPGGDTVTLLHPLPQRSGPRRGQFIGRRDRGRAPGRMHDQRYGRAGWQCCARGNRDGAQGAPRCNAVPHRHRYADACTRLQARVERHGVSRPVQQGHRGQECVCA